MADRQQEKAPLLSTGQKKGLVWVGMIATVLVLIWFLTEETEPGPPAQSARVESILGGSDLRSVTLGGLNDRLVEMEQSFADRTDEYNRAVGNLENALRDQSDALARMQAENRRMEGELEEVRNRPASIVRETGPASSAPERFGTDSPRDGDAIPGGQDGSGDPDRFGESSGAIADTVPAETPFERAERERLAAEEALRLEREARIKREREAIYSAPEAMPNLAPAGPAGPVPRIAVYASEVAPEEEEERVMIEIPAGSIIQSVLLTGLDAPTGIQASAAPVPVLMRIKAEAIMPNYALGDIRECHLLGAAYGELASERVNIRGETVSCILADNSAVEGSVKFFVTGEDGKNGLKGRLVTRAGRMISGAVAASLTQGLIGALSDTSNAVTVSGLQGTQSGAISGAQDGFDMISEYYLDLAEETFPVIEVTNNRWVDVVLTEGLRIAWKGGRS